MLFDNSEVAKILPKRCHHWRHDDDCDLSHRMCQNIPIMRTKKMQKKRLSPPPIDRLRLFPSIIPARSILWTRIDATLGRSALVSLIWRGTLYQKRSLQTWLITFDKSKGIGLRVTLVCASGRCENGSWFDHVLEWWEASKADPEHVLFLRYEDMVLHPAESIKTIAEFTGIEVTPEIIEKVRERNKHVLGRSTSWASCKTDLGIPAYISVTTTSWRDMETQST